MKSIIYQGRVLAVPQANGEFIFSHLPDPDPDPDPGSPHKCVAAGGTMGKSLLDSPKLLRFMMTEAAERQQRVEVVKETMTEWE